MNAQIIFLASFVIWYIIGAMVLAALDDDNQSLLNWAKSFPYGSGFGVFLVIICFPYIIYLHVKNKRESKGRVYDNTD